MNGDRPVRVSRWFSFRLPLPSDPDFNEAEEISRRIYEARVRAGVCTGAMLAYGGLAWLLEASYEARLGVVRRLEAAVLGLLKSFGPFGPRDFG
ncbi:hypothetical protein ES332_A05G407400v1 [Gossypium tomentosum]|uniref:Uncharacterized protein n=1 Tax=Gossypium tomentosum TaxID=34277 RepID=A0A5D2QR96_GOSTO|nr:hypothetical protein ES332_A05G407400v1 [Gossypium tomentosum]